MNQSERRLFLIRALLRESHHAQEIPPDSDGQRLFLRGLMNIRRPQETPAELLRVQDEYLQAETAAKGITDIADLTPIQPGLYLWQGDITTFRCDAIVNAANSGLTGCYIPNHHCIDNAIHTYAGIELRLACMEQIAAQGRLETAAANDLESVAFCCISTGEFYFPNETAAEIAVRTVKEFLAKQTIVRKVIFNVFKDMDREIYTRLLHTDSASEGSSR